MSISTNGLLRIIVCLLLMIGLGSSTSAQSRFKYWVCRVLGINVRTYDQLSRARPGDYQPVVGSRLMRVKLPDEEEQLVWKCDDCWSPVMANKTDVAVLKPDGIWVVSTANNRTAPEHAKVTVRNVVAIIGRLNNKPNRLIVAQRSDVQPCKFTLLLANLDAEKIGPLGGDAVTCLGGAIDLFLSIDAGRILKDKLLFAPANTSGTPRTLWVHTLKPSQEFPNGPSSRLIPKIDKRDDGIDRFDANWINSHEVIYVARP